ARMPTAAAGIQSVLGAQAQRLQNAGYAAAPACVLHAASGDVCAPHAVHDAVRLREPLRDYRVVPQWRGGKPGHSEITNGSRLKSTRRSHAAAKAVRMGACSQLKNSFLTRTIFRPPTSPG